MGISRRRFLKSTAAATGAVALPLGISTTAYGANDQIRVAVIGLNGRGKSHIGGLRNHIVALCDCDAGLLAGRAKGF